MFRFYKKTLNLNNASASLGGGYYLGTLNLKLKDWKLDGGSLKEPIRFF